MTGDSLSKQARSEAQRLETLKRKKELEKQRQAVIANALKAVDGPSSKKIVFDDSEDEEDDEIRPVSNTPSKSNSEPPSKKTKLFEDDSEEGEENEEFVIPNRLAGKKGEKLMKLETKFNDTRFKLDDKFASSESEAEEEHDEMGEEKAKNRELLAKVLGKNVAAPKKDKNKDEAAKKAPPRPFTRFDPENEEHVKWMKLYGGGDKKNEGKEEDESSSSSSDDEEKEEEEPLVNSAEHFYEMDTTFAEELKSKIAGNGEASTGFSFLAMMGRKEPVPMENKSTGVEEDIRPNKKLMRILGREDDFEAAEDTYDETLNGKELAPTSSKFFLTGKEPHIKSVLANFRMTQSLEKTVGLWTTYRDSIMKIYRHQRKDARKRQKESKNFFSSRKGGKDQKAAKEET